MEARDGGGKRQQRRGVRHPLLLAREQAPLVGQPRPQQDMVRAAFGIERRERDGGDARLPVGVEPPEPGQAFGRRRQGKPAQQGRAIEGVALDDVAQRARGGGGADNVGRERRLRREGRRGGEGKGGGDRRSADPCRRRSGHAQLRNMDLATKSTLAGRSARRRMYQGNQYSP